MVRIKKHLDRLTSTVGLLGILLVYPYLDLPAQFVLPLALLIGAWCDHRGRYLVTRWPATLLSFAVFLLYVLQLGRNNLVDPVVNLAVLLLAVRLLTEKEGRHYLQIFMLSSFALAASTLYTLTLAFLPILVVMLCSLIFGLVLLAFHTSKKEMQINREHFRMLLRTILLLPACSLLLMLLFFLVLPRTEHALWDFLNPGGKSRSALAEQVKPGAFASSAADDTVAFRVEMDEIPAASLYWRTLTLDVIEEDTWVRGDTPPSSRPELSNGTVIRQEIYPEHFSNRYITSLDVPEAIQGVRHSWLADGTARMHRAYKKQHSYRAESRIGGTYRERSATSTRLLDLPPGLAPRAREAARERMTPDMTRNQRIAAIEGFFMTLKLNYATENLPTGGDPVDTFLFASQRGYCEYFASSFAVMLREAGVPARLVGGYLGGEYNPLGGYYAVTERMAHVWVEALSDNGIWLRLDPSRFAVNADTALIASRTGRALGLRQVMDSIDYFWNQAIVTFDIERQTGALRNMRDQIRSIGKNRVEAKPYLVPVLATLALGAVAIYIYRRRLESRKKKLLQRFLNIVRKKGGLEEHAPSVGLTEMARSSQTHQATEFIRIYGGAVYRDRALSKEEIDRLQTLLKEMRKEL